MVETEQTNRYYCKGENPDLDKKFAQYKKLNIFAGSAVDNALSDKEGDTLVELWCKERMNPRKLDVREVLALVKFSEMILQWRKNKRREKTRIRNERARRKLRDELKKGNEEAERKLQAIKKADVLRSEKYRKVKREMRDKIKEGDVDGQCSGM